jgi:hypothetical protein
VVLDGPIAIQTAFAKAMLDADDVPPEVFYADDHFVTYWGSEPVAKGNNIRRHLAEPGRDDTFMVDDTWRAVCFASGEPRGLSVTLPEVLGQLKEIVGDRRVMVGFDRGGSYPKVFTALAEANLEWITWRRAPLPVPTVTPKRSRMNVDGKRCTNLLADEVVILNGYDATPVRHLGRQAALNRYPMSRADQHPLASKSASHRRVSSREQSQSPQTVGTTSRVASRPAPPTRSNHPLRSLTRSMMPLSSFGLMAGIWPPITTTGQWPPPTGISVVSAYRRVDNHRAGHRAA